MQSILNMSAPRSGKLYKEKAPRAECFFWLRGLDLNQRPSGYEPDELPTAPPRDESWWRGLDSNQRSETRQIYSLLPLATREPLHILELAIGLEPTTC